MELLSAVLCQNERLLVYPLIHRDSARWRAIDSIYPSDRSRRRFRDVASAVLALNPQHSDLLLTVEKTEENILIRNGIRATFFITDGSYYPSRVPALGQRVRTVRDRLIDLQAIAERLRSENAGFFIIGLNAHRSPAIDPDLTLIDEDHRYRRLDLGVTSLDLESASGEDVLSTVFSTAYSASNSLNTWDLLITQGVWAHRFGYTDGWRQSLQELQDVTMEHLLFLPPSPQERHACRSVTGNSADAVQAIRIAAGSWACSIAQPTRALINRMHGQSITSFAFKQKERFYPRENHTILRGLHEFVIAARDSACASSILSQHIVQGGRWPLRGDTVTRMEIIEAANTTVRDTVDLVRYGDTHCLVPVDPFGSFRSRTGDHLLVLRDTGGAWIQSRRFMHPQLLVTELSFIPSGFPFPPDRLALVHVCVRTRRDVAVGNAVAIDLGNRTYNLVPKAPPCALDKEPSSYPYTFGFSGVVLLENTNLSVARVSIVTDKTKLQADAGTWIPVQLRRTGRWFLSTRVLIAVGLVGALFQIGYLWLFAKIKWNEVTLRRGISLLLSVLISAVLFLVGGGFIAMLHASPLETAAVPVSFALLVFAHVVNLFAAALMPELVEEALLREQ